MSRVAKKPLVLPAGVQISSTGDLVSVSGPKGTLSTSIPHGVSLEVSGQDVSLVQAVGASSARAGTLRALLGNMAQGVSVGYQRKLELVGVGYRASLTGKDLNLTLGFSHPVVFVPPAGVTIEVPTQIEIWIKGADKQAVGQVAAKIRAYRPPEPYKGKGVRYAGEKIVMKEAKKA